MIHRVLEHRSFARATVLAAACVMGMTAAHAQSADVVGGVAAKPGAYPFQVSLVHSYLSDNRMAHRCGATLISPRDVLTAGHCPVGGDDDPSWYEVLIGTQDLGSGGARVPIERVTIHPKYNYLASDHDHDIAVIRLAQPVTGITPIPYVRNLKQEAKAAPVGKATTLLGWGMGDSQLQEGALPILDRQVCAQQPGYEILTPRMLCAGELAGGIASCSGDSGGPLLAEVTNAQGEKQKVQVGVVSWGRGCGTPKAPSVFARLGTLGKWVAAQVARP